MHADARQQHAQDLVQAALISGLTPDWKAELRAAVVGPDAPVFLPAYLKALYGDLLTQAQVDEHFGTAAPGFARACQPLPEPAFTQAVEGLVSRLQATQGPWLSATGEGLASVQAALKTALIRAGASDAQQQVVAQAFARERPAPADPRRARVRR